MRARGSLRWIALALLGLVIAAAVALAASHLASQQIGIASESVSAGDSLAPPVTSVRRQRHDDGAGSGAAKGTEPAGGSGAESPPETAEPEAPAGESELSPGPTEGAEPEGSGGPSTSGGDDGGGGGGGGGGGEGRDD